MTDPTFAPYHTYYRTTSGKRATLTIHPTPNTITLITPTNDHLHFTPLEAGLLLDALTSAIHTTTPFHDCSDPPPFQ